MTWFWLRNLLFYSLQMGALLAAGGIALRALRIRTPSQRLLCWQALLAVGVVLPFLEPWQHSAVAGGVQTTQWVLGAMPQGHSSTPVSLASMCLIVLASGVTFRLLRLLFGALRLRQIVRRSTLSENQFPALQEQLQVRAEIRLSNDVSGPVTAGWFRPVVLVAEKWAADEMVLCHELIHVRRRDWPISIAEELLGAIFWFHPALQWALAQIQLCREAVVDAAVVRTAGSRERYLHTLLSIASGDCGFETVPAPLFLRRRQLPQRVAYLLEENPMNHLRARLSVAAFFTITAVASALAVASFPLRATPQESKDTKDRQVRVGGNVMSKKLIRKVQPQYPVEAKEAHVQGVVTLAVTIAKDGSAKEVDVMDGPKELTEAAQTAVRQWIWETTLLNGEPVEVLTVVNVNFTLTK